MQYKIASIKAKINDAAPCNTLNVSISNDTGVKCTIMYSLGAISATPSTIFSQKGLIMLTGNFVLTEGDYTNYKVVADKMKFAADYVAAHMTPTLTII
jgi:hypothetical protein